MKLGLAGESSVCRACGPGIYKCIHVYNTSIELVGQGEASCRGAAEYNSMS